MSGAGKHRLVSLIVGLLFGAGLAISGMVLPEKVIGFLDVTGTWDPSLAFVMIGAILVHMPFIRWARRRGKSFLGDGLQLPSRKDIDWRLVVGATVFGIGWGITGICPGPGIVNLVTLSSGIVAFVAAMLVGMVAEHLFERRIATGRTN
jgi:uncharacterized membrane protein YedE/YeeE